MAMMGYIIFTKYPGRELHHQMVQCHIQDTRWEGSYPLAEMQSAYSTTPADRSENEFLLVLYIYNLCVYTRVCAWDSYEFYVTISSYGLTSTSNISCQPCMTVVLNFRTVWAKADVLKMSDRLRYLFFLARNDPITIIGLTFCISKGFSQIRSSMMHRLAFIWSSFIILSEPKNFQIFLEQMSIFLRWLQDSLSFLIREWHMLAFLYVLYC